MLIPLFPALSFFGTSSDEFIPLYPRHLYSNSGFVAIIHPDNFFTSFTYPDSPVSLAAFVNATSNHSHFNLTAIRDLASINFAPAEYLMGDLNFFGLSHPQNFRAAADFYTRSATHGFPYALARLALLHRYGLGVPKDIPKAVAYRHVSCHRGSVQSCLAQSFSDLVGDLTPASHASYLHRSYAISQAISNLLWTDMDCLIDISMLPPQLNFGTRASTVESSHVTYFQNNAARGDDAAALKLATIYQNGHFGVPRDVPAARDLYAAAAARGNPEAARNLANLYATGNGVPLDLAKAKALYAQAAAANDAQALNGLGFVAELENDLELSAQYYQQAADAGENLGLYNIGVRTYRNASYDRAADHFGELVDRGFLHAFHLSVMSMMLSNSRLDRGRMNATLRALLQRGPWRRYAREAEELWHMGNRAGAVAMWMEAAEAGNGIAAYNAGIALLKDRNLKLGETTVRERLRIAVRMFKFASVAGWGGGPLNVDDRIAEVYAALERSDKMAKTLAGAGKTALACYLQAVAALRSEEGVELKDVVTNLTAAARLDWRFLVVDLAFLPEISRVIAREVWASVRQNLDWQRLGGVLEAVRIVLATSANFWAPGVVTVVLMAVVRLRLGIAFSSPRF
jgi:TPR repeat protein